MNQNDKKLIEYIKARCKKEFLIDPLGKIHRYNKTDIKGSDSIHHIIASKLLPDAEYPLDALIQLGWISISNINKWKYKRISQSQINTLENEGYCIDYLLKELEG